jgi:hypothetical protein
MSDGLTIIPQRQTEKHHTALNPDHNAEGAAKSVSADPGDNPIREPPPKDILQTIGHEKHL